MIQLENLYKSYTRSKNADFAVKDVSLVAKDGEVSALLGVNGSGKTSILKCIACHHYPTKGRVLVSGNNGEMIDTAKNPALAKMNIGFVPESSELPMALTARKFLEYAASLYGVSDITEVTAKFSLDSVLDKKIYSLSKGYRQRLSFAQALLHNPKTLILDEPITGLDPAQIAEMRSLILEEAKSKTVLISTHILQEVHSLSARAFIMNHGKLVASGTENEIISAFCAQSFEEAFFKAAENEIAEEK